MFFVYTLYILHICVLYVYGNFDKIIQFYVYTLYLYCLYCFFDTSFLAYYCTRPHRILIFFYVLI